MARGTPDEEVYQPRVQPEDLPRKIVPQASPEDFGYSIGSGASQIGQVLEQKYQADSATYAGDQLAAFRQKAVQNLETMKANAPAGDPGNFTEKYLTQFDKDAEPLASQVQSNPIATQMISKGVQQLRQTLADHTLQWEATQRVAYRTDSIRQNLSDQLPLVEAHPELATQVGSTLMDQINASGADPASRLPIARQMHAELSMAAANGLTRQNPQGVLDALNNPESAQGIAKSVLSDLNDAQREALRAKASGDISSSAANGIVDVYRAQGPTAGAQALKAVDASGQPDDIKKQIYAQVEQGVSQWHQEQRQQAAPTIIGLETRLATNKPAPGDSAAVWSLYHSGAYTADQTGETLGRIQRAQEAQVQDQAWVHYATQAYQQSIPLDPRDKDARGAIDTVFTTATKGLTPGSAEWINRGADIAHRTGVTPDSMVEWSRAQLVSADPSTAAAAAQTVERLQEANPRGTPYALDDKDKALARLIDDAVIAGTDPKTAVTNARAIQSMPDAEKLRLDDAYKRQQLAQTAEGALRTELKNQPEYKGGWFTGLPDLPPAMTGQFEELRQNYFKLTGGNKDQAADLAMRDLKNTWGVTQVNGKREFMQYAPEEHAGIPTALLRSDMEDSVKGHTDDPSKVRLVSTPDTASTNGHIWALGVPDKTGAYDVVRDAQHNPIPYQLPDPAAALAAARAKEAQAGMAKLKAAQALELEREKNELGELQIQGRRGGY